MSSIHEQENIILKNLNSRDKSLQLYEEPGLDDKNFPNIKKVVNRINQSNDETITYEDRRHENEFIIQWYKEHKGCAGFPKESWNDDGFKTNSLREYLLDKVRGSKPDEFNKLIEDTKAAIGMECPDDFGYGDGGRKKSRRRTRRLAK